MERAQAIQRIQRLQKRAAISLWVSFFGAVLLYLLFVWLSVWRPHIGWWWLTTCLVVISAAVSLLLMLGQLPGEGRIRAIGVFMIATLPLAWFAAFLWSTVIVLDARENVKLNAPVRALGLWAGSYFELEARWRYPRITEGKHVQLFDDGSTPNVEQMVADMDLHIEQMAATLENEIPSTKVRWVRGSLFGQTGRAIGAWAICDTDSEELDYLDEHEVAHCTITMMCPVDQEMPMLLCEGWAQSQSSYKPMAILRLLDEKASDEALTLDEIISNSYGRSTGPAYQYGASFAWYLLERFGGAKFVELYGSVRRASFKQDVERILDVAWDQLETDFWTWLEARREWAQQTRTSEAENSLIEFEREGDAKRWQEMLDTVRTAEAEFKFLENVAFEVSRRGSTWSENRRIAISNDGVWAIHDELSKTRNIRRIQIATTDVCRHFIDEDGKVLRSDDYGSSNPEQEASFLKTFWFRRNSLCSVMMIDLTDLSSRQDRKFVIHKIEPITDSSLWNFCFSEIYESHPTNNRQVEAIIDSSRNFDVVEIPSEIQRDVQTKHVFEFGVIRDTEVLTKWTSMKENGDGFESTLAELSADAAKNLREEVESAVGHAEEVEPASAPKRQSNQADWSSTISSWLINPMALAIAWPAFGLLLLAIDVVCDRFRWKAG